MIPLSQFVCPTIASLVIGQPFLYNGSEPTLVLSQSGMDG